jgi:hypothetical protein
MSCHQPAYRSSAPPRRDQHRRSPPRIPGHHRQHRQQLRRAHLTEPGWHRDIGEPEITLRDLPGRIAGPRRRIRWQVNRPQLRDPPAESPDRIRPPDPPRDHRRRHRRIRLQQLPDPRLERIRHRPNWRPLVFRRPVTGQRHLHRVPRDTHHTRDLRDRHALRPAKPADLSPVLPGSTPARVSGKLVNFRLPRSDQYSLAADSRSANRTEEIMDRALRVPQRAANNGRERAVTVRRDVEQVQQWQGFSLVTGPQAAG